MIQILIERWVEGEAEAALLEAMRELRREAIHQPGYVSGETLRDTANPRHHVVLSTWQSLPEWNAWFNSSIRQETESKVADLFAKPEKITILEQL